MTLLVTGGAGFIGSNFVLDWFASQQTQGEAVFTLDSLTYAGNPENLAALQGDICDRALVDQLLAQHRPYAIVQFAAANHVDRSIHGLGAVSAPTWRAPSPCWRPCTPTGAAWILRPRRPSASTTSPPTRSIAAWSRVMPPSPKPTPTSPTAPFSASKAASDHLVRTWHHTYGLPVLTPNCSNNYVPFHFNEKLINGYDRI